VIEHFAGMPYAPMHRKLRAHALDCERCAEALATGEGDCSAFCETGHMYVHLVAKRMAATAAASRWN